MTPIDREKRPEVKVETEFVRGMDQPPTYWEQVTEYMDGVRNEGMVAGAAIGGGIGATIHILLSRSDQITQLDNPFVIGLAAGGVVGAAVGEFIGWSHAIKTAQIQEAMESHI